MNPPKDPANKQPRNYSRLKLLAVLLTLFGIGLFGYFIYAVGFYEIVEGVDRFGIAGFAVILMLYFLRLMTRAQAWKMCVHEPDRLHLRDTVPAVIIGEALSSTIPLGILISGTSKAIAVRKKIPLVAGLSSVATENLFYSLVTSLLLIAGAAVMLRTYAVDEGLIFTVNVLIATVTILLLLGILMVVRQWHFASAFVNWLYEKGFLRRLLETNRHEVRRFEDLIYSFYRKYPRRFLPVCFLEVLYHALGIAEIWYILSRISDAIPSLLNAFLLETVSRLVTIIFKLVPFVIGVDEAGAQFVGETVSLGAGVAVTLAIIRKGRILFWTAVGVILIIKRGLSIREISAALDGQ
ncbi:MAG: lysylphosphatidylglycerol synthase transmembrane domain-containing protein [Pyrinomonadaceae bacterium]